MASVCTLFSVCVVICISAGKANTDFVSLQCDAENVGQYGQQSLLKCVIHTTQEVSNPEIRVVIWRKIGVRQPLLVFYDGKIDLMKGYEFAEQSWNKKNMNVSLLITDTKVADDGGYECEVNTDSGQSKSKTKLQVTAKYNEPTINSLPKKIPQGADGTLICDSDGGYPKGELRWFDKYNTDWTKSSEMEASQTENGLFRLSSKLMLKSGSIFKYTCVVFNASGGKVNEAEFDPGPDFRTAENGGSGGGNLSSKVVAPVVVIGSLIVGLLMALLFIRRRSQQARRQSTAPLMGDHQQVCTCEIEEGDPKNMDIKSQPHQV